MSQENQTVNTEVKTTKKPGGFIVVVIVLLSLGLLCSLAFNFLMVFALARYVSVTSVSDLGEVVTGGVSDGSTGDQPPGSNDNIDDVLDDPAKEKRMDVEITAVYDDEDSYKFSSVFPADSVVRNAALASVKNDDFMMTFARLPREEINIYLTFDRYELLNIESKHGDIFKLHIKGNDENVYYYTNTDFDGRYPEILKGGDISGNSYDIQFQSDYTKVPLNITCESTDAKGFLICEKALEEFLAK